MKHGGVVIYISDKIPFKICDDLRDDLSLLSEGEFESIVIETCLNQRMCLLVEVYRVPNTNETASTVERFGFLSNKIRECGTQAIIGTDQNFDLFKINSHGNTADLLTQAFSYGIVPTITKPTRVIHSVATLIDNIYLTSTLSYTLQYI